MTITCAYCGKEHQPAARDKDGRPMCPRCAGAAWALCRELFGRIWSKV